MGKDDSALINILLSEVGDSDPGVIAKLELSPNHITHGVDQLFTGRFAVFITGVDIGVPNQGLLAFLHRERIHQNDGGVVDGGKGNGGGLLCRFGRTCSSPIVRYGYGVGWSRC